MLGNSICVYGIKVCPKNVLLKAAKPTEQS